MNTPSVLITGAQVLAPGKRSERLDVLISDDKIDTVASQIEVPSARHERVDGSGLLLTPGLIDLHVHGVGYSVFESSPDALLLGSQVLPQYGTTCVLPTLYAVMTPEKLDRLESLAIALDNVTGAAMPGFHLEGPFLAIPGAGARTLDGDLVFLKELLSAAQGRVPAMSVSPETKNILPVIEQLTELEIAVFLTHTAASVEQTTAAIDAGARHATHFYDVFPVPAETDLGVRPVGAIETILSDARCSVDFICDGVHVHPTAIRAALAAKNWQGVSAITDGNIGSGLGNGVYQTPWGYSVEISDAGGARVANPELALHGALAGSALTMNVAMENLAGWLDLPTEQIWAMGTLNPAQTVGLAKKGRIETGADADLVLWDCHGGQFQVIQTWVAGKSVYQKNDNLVRTET
jgi:N-acetylglucosamine-6-phosphate deacetylase